MNESFNLWKLINHEQRVRDRIHQQFFVPVKGGHQIKTVYLGEDLVVYIPRRRHPIYWNKNEVLRIEGFFLVGPIYKWFRKQKSSLIFQFKQGAKWLVAYLRKDPKAGPFAMNETFQSYEISRSLEHLIDPFLILDEIELKIDKNKNIRLSPVIIRERCDESLIDLLKELIRCGNDEEAKRRVDDAIRLDEQIWQKHVFNIDFSFKNYRVRRKKMVLRDLGSLSDDYAKILFNLERLHGMHGPIEYSCHPIRKNFARISAFSQALGDYYLERARIAYSIENFRRIWESEASKSFKV